MILIGHEEKIFSLSKLGLHQQMEWDYVMYWIKNPEPMSVFARRTRYIRLFPQFALKLLIRHLNFLNYDGLLFIKNKTIAGHIFYQRHDRELRAFSLAVSPEFSNKSYYKHIVKKFLIIAFGDQTINGVIIGKGGSVISKQIYQKVLNDELRLPFKVELNNNSFLIKFIRN